MINYDSFSHCHLTDIFFAIFAGAKELSDLGWEAGEKEPELVLFYSGSPSLYVSTTKEMELLC